MANKYLITTSGNVSWATTTNWSGLAVPVNSDVVTIPTSTAAINAGLNQKAVTLASLDINSSFTGSIGMAVQALKAVTNATESGTTATLTSAGHGYSVGDVVRVAGCSDSKYNGLFTITAVTTDTFNYETTAGATSPETETTATVVEEDYLNIKATKLTIGSAAPGITGTGSGRVKINLQDAQSTVLVLGSNSSSTDSGLESIRLLGTHASNSITVISGKVGIATTNIAETSTFALANVAGQNATLNFGVGATLTTLNISAGSLSFKSAVTTLNVNGGTAQAMEGDYAITSANVQDGTLKCRNVKSAAASIGTLYGYPGGTLDLTECPATTAATFTVTHLYHYPGFTIKLNRAALDTFVVTNWHQVGTSQMDFT